MSALAAEPANAYFSYTGGQYGRTLLGEDLREYIAGGARRRGVEPAAVLAVVHTEGGFQGAVGDGGTSFGPFQLHAGGALPVPAARGRAFAQSERGVDYALDRIAGVARGQTGADAIASIVYRFERPADPAGGVRRAVAVYDRYVRYNEGGRSSVRQAGGQLVGNRPIVTGLPGLPVPGLPGLPGTPDLGGILGSVLPIGFLKRAGLVLAGVALVVIGLLLAANRSQVGGQAIDAASSAVLLRAGRLR